VTRLQLKAVAVSRQEAFLDVKTIILELTFFVAGTLKVSPITVNPRGQSTILSSVHCCFMLNYLLIFTCSSSLGRVQVSSFNYLGNS
jgi:hypothetical protein